MSRRPTGLSRPPPLTTRPRSVISAAIANLAREVEIAVEPPFSAMLRPPIPWSQLDQASGKSQYVDDVAGALEHVAVVVRQELENKRYVRSWSDKVVG